MNDYKPSKIEDFYLNEISINNINFWKKNYVERSKLLER